MLPVLTGRPAPAGEKLAINGPVQALCRPCAGLYSLSETGSGRAGTHKKPPNSPDAIFCL
jgi:hypothetical protein